MCQFVSVLFVFTPAAVFVLVLNWVSDCVFVNFCLLIIEEVNYVTEYNRRQYRFVACVVFSAILKHSGRFNCFVGLISTIRMYKGFLKKAIHGSCNSRSLENTIPVLLYRRKRS